MPALNGDSMSGTDDERRTKQVPSDGPFGSPAADAGSSTSKTTIDGESVVHSSDSSFDNYVGPLSSSHESEQEQHEPTEKCHDEKEGPELPRQPECEQDQDANSGSDQCEEQTAHRSAIWEISVALLGARGKEEVHSSGMVDNRGNEETQSRGMVTEYYPDIQNEIFQVEHAFMADPRYMDQQNEINPRMRGILFDWLAEVHNQYAIAPYWHRPETLHLTVNLVDRYLSRSIVVRRRLQLVGVCAMYIASKFECIRPPRAEDLAYITANAYTKQEILTMECNMLTTLCFQINGPTAMHFMEFFLVANNSDNLHRELVRYIVEMQLLEYRMIRHTPSLVVAAGIYLANELTSRQLIWPVSMAQATTYREERLRPVVTELRAFVDADSDNAVRRRYSREEHLRVAILYSRNRATL